jgi:hypothetical protein
LGFFGGGDAGDDCARFGGGDGTDIEEERVLLTSTCVGSFVERVMTSVWRRRYFDTGFESGPINILDEGRLYLNFYGN